VNAPWLAERARERLLRAIPERWTAVRVGKYLGITHAKRESIG
jgi:hypothetical protein